MLVVGCTSKNFWGAVGISRVGLEYGGAAGQVATPR